LDEATEFVKTVVLEHGRVGALYVYEGGNRNPLTYRVLSHNVPRNQNNNMRFAVMINPGHDFLKGFNL